MQGPVELFSARCFRRPGKRAALRLPRILKAQTASFPADSPPRRSLHLPSLPKSVPGCGSRLARHDPTPYNDVGRWKVKYDAKRGLAKSVSWSARHVADRDTHVELVLNPRDSATTQRVIVEVTPAGGRFMAARGVDWSTRALRDRFLGRWVRVVARRF